jgi:hypothetical protein
MTHALASWSRTTRIEFEADIVLADEEIDAAGGLERAVQNMIGPSGARLIQVTSIAEGPVARSGGRVIP